MNCSLTIVHYSNHLAKTLERMLGTQEGCTQYPCKLFCLLVDPGESLQDDESEWDERVENPIPEYCVRVPRVLLSPCQVRVIDVGTEMSNRAIRRFTKELHLGPCSFLRLQVGDETGKHLFGDLTPSICTHISTVVLNGFKVNGQMFKFLAYSSSRKYQGCYSTCVIFDGSHSETTSSS